MTRTYRIRTAARTGTIIVTEHADRVALRLTLDRLGDFGDSADIARQLWPVLARFDRDPRPLLFESPDTGSRAAIDVDGSGRPFAVVTEEPRQ